jgi:hypothetical protein
MPNPAPPRIADMPAEFKRYRQGIVSLVKKTHPVVK